MQYNWKKVKRPAFTCLPVGVVLETDNPMNLFQPYEKMNPRFRIQSVNPCSGGVAYSVLDIFKREIRRGAVHFSTIGNSVPTMVKLPDFSSLDSGTDSVHAKLVTPVSREQFDNFWEAEVLIESWRREYNQIRPHSTLNYLPPAPQTVDRTVILRDACLGKSSGSTPGRRPSSLRPCLNRKDLLYI